MTTEARIRWIGLAFATMLSVQIFSVPRGAGPDESAHLVRSAGIVRGEVLGSDGPETSTRIFDVPGWVGLPAASCYAFNEGQPISCVRSLERTGPLESSAASYQIWPHLLPGLGTLFPGQESTVWISRLFGAAIPLLLLWLAATRLVRRADTLASATFLLALTPAAISTIAVVNPSGLAIAGAMAMTVGLLGIGVDEVVERRRGHTDAWLAVGGLCAMVLARSDGIVWAACLIVAMAMFRGRGFLSNVWEAIPKQALAATTLAGLLCVGWLWAVPPALIDQEQSESGVVLLTRIVGRTGQHLIDAIGTAGWLDARVPDSMILVWLLALGVAVGSVIGSARTTEIRAVLALAVLVVVTPWILEYSQAATAGLYWQGRYSLPLIAGAIIVVGSASSRTASSPRVTSFIGGATWLVWNLGLYQQLRRWSVGESGSLAPWNLDTGFGPVLTVGAVIAYAMASALLLVSMCTVAAPVQPDGRLESSVADA